MDLFFLRILIIALAMLTLSGCTDNNEGDTRIDEMSDKIVGTYHWTGAQYAESGCYLDLDGDGLSSENYYEELTTLGNVTNIKDSFSSVARPSYKTRKGTISIFFPVQGLTEKNGRIATGWICGNKVFALVRYNINEKGEIAFDTIDIYPPDYIIDVSISSPDVQVSFPNPGTMEMKITCLLYDYSTATAQEYRVIHEFTRYRN